MPVHYRYVFMERKESTSFLFSGLLLILWLISVSHTHSCFAGQLHAVFRFAGADLPEPLPNAAVSLGVDFSMPVEFLLSFLQYAVSQGVAGCRLVFL